jgi:Xaa-Pro dipeptidase
MEVGNMALLFELSEYKERLRKTKESMLRSGIQVLVVSDPANMNYLTGYDGWSFYVHQGLVVALDYDEPIWWGRGMDANGAKITTWLKHDNIRPYADDYVQNKFKHPMSFVADIIREKGLGNPKHRSGKGQLLVYRGLPGHLAGGIAPRGHPRRHEPG